MKSNLLSIRCFHLRCRGVLSMLVLVLMLLSSSCKSHRTVVRGDQGKPVAEAVKSKKQDKKTTPKKSSNKYTNALLNEAYKWLGTPYEYGGQSRKGADCSGFVMVVFRDALGIKLPRVSRDQGEYCKKIDRKELRPGDLMFFATSGGNKVSHVGLYIGDNKMIHASASKGVIIVDIDMKYFVDHYHHSGRVMEYYRLVNSK